MNVGRRAVFAEIAYRLVQGGNERTVCSWYAVDRDTMFSILSIPLEERKAGRNFPYHSGENIVEKIKIWRGGAVLNSSDTSYCIGAAVAQVALLFVVVQRPVHLHIKCADSQQGEEFFVYLQNTFQGSQGVVIKLLHTTEFSVLIGRYKRRSGCVFDALGNMECLMLEGSREVDTKLAGAGDLKGLKILNIANRHVSSLFPIRSLQNLEEIDASGTAINDPDVVVLSQLLRLRRLILDRCEGLTSIAPLAGHPALEILSTVRCAHLRIIRALYTILSLRIVDLSFTNVPPGELLRFLGGLGAVVDLTLNGLRLSAVNSGFTANEHLRRLSINGMNTVGFKWVCALAPFLREFFLDETHITGKELDDISQLLPFLEIISLVGCMSLRTSLLWVLLMKNLCRVVISRHSLADDNVIEITYQYNVDCQVV